MQINEDSDCQNCILTFPSSFQSLNQYSLFNHYEEGFSATVIDWNSDFSKNHPNFFILQNNSERFVPFFDSRMGVFGSKEAQNSFNIDEEKEVERESKKRDTGMDKRKDQVIRDLLRKIRRTYKRLFYETTEYLKTERSLDRLYKCLLKYVEKNICETNGEEIAITLGCMLFPTKMKEMFLKNQLKFDSNFDKYSRLEMIKTFTNLFKRFNFKNLKAFVNCGDMATLLIHFPEIYIPYKLSDDEAVGFGIIEEECMLTLTY